jgi:KUP system potassium uptake protein
MEAAYGLAITITMLMTSILLLYYLRVEKLNVVFIGILGVIFLSIEISFLIANLIKFPHGGWVALLIGLLLVSVMFIWFKSRKIKNRYIEFTKLDKHLPILKELSEDDTVPKYATNLVYLTSADYPNEIETKIIYSIFNKQPKRAEIYWFIHVDILDEPHTMEYDVRVLVPDKVYKIDFKLGFREDPKINLFFRKVVEDMSLNHEVNIISRYKSLKKHNIVGDFKFVVIDRVLNYDYELKTFDQFIMAAYSALKRISLSEEKAFGLDTSSVTTETVPLITVPPKEVIELELIRAKRV